jgi:hypothetical protein
MVSRLAPCVVFKTGVLIFGQALEVSLSYLIRYMGMIIILNLMFYLEELFVFLPKAEWRLVHRTWKFLDAKHLSRQCCAFLFLQLER